MVTEPHPFHSMLDLAVEPSAVRWARVHARDVFTTWQIPSATADDALLVVSELVTNAVRHARPAPAAPTTAGVSPKVRACALVLQCMPGHLLICVHDQDRRPPVLKETSEEGESGRGLHLVAELSAAWGYAYPNPAVGKAVWAKITTGDGTAGLSPRGAASGRRASPRKHHWLSRCRITSEHFRVGAASVWAPR